MTETHASWALPGVARWMISSLETQLPTVTERIAGLVSDGAGGQRGRLVRQAVQQALRLFVDQVLDRPTSTIVVDDLFRKLGYRQAARGRDREAIDHAMQVAAAEISDELRVRAAENGLSADALNALNDAVSSFLDYLARQAQHGFDAGLAERAQDVGIARTQLIEALLAAVDPADAQGRATAARWDIPELVTVLAVDLGPDDHPLDGDDLGAEALTGQGSPQVVLCDSTVANAVTKRIRAAAPGRRIARCWPVVVTDVPAAWRWSHRALALVRARVIPKRPVIDCARYRTEIWLHAEPVMRRQLAQDLLQPLFAESENSREILSETLLVWLETRESAPAIAARLGVHPQTVRYRWKRINELFGEVLHDPDVVTQLLLVLKASVPLWIAGDQSDFERYKSTQDP
ncbi:helix-turn-helix domain-containing protein [Nocardioides nitrophenolicus]|uniref:PucR family transcriptional regulator n=1 Tax=Nocardioides nitrophenolicus TaxID=60489 RepID=UPI00195B2B5F|nr:helix-turn-helix domain-containing protein [Nocardioides nitrophenolicus]MBM7516294.1 plasmid stability protein [Nocardioides nitrophenolicus]